MSKISKTSNFEIMDASERIKRFGLECRSSTGNGVTFVAGSWHSGGEFVQKLIVRNVTTSLKKFKYKLPSSRFFSMPFPETIALSPGMSKEIDVSFRPIEYQAYDDAIFISMVGEASGGFNVSVKALIEKLQITAPSGLDLGYCATNQITSLVFQLMNVGEVDAPFRWDVPEPFALEPMEGIVPIGGTHDIIVSIIPSDASVFVSRCICHVGEGVHADIPEPSLTVKFSAIGKYAFIALSESDIDFGEVAAGTLPQHTTREVVLRNQNVVDAEFICSRQDHDREEVFAVSPTRGIVRAGEEVTVTVTFAARAFGTYSLDNYVFRTPGACDATLTVRGFAMAPQVELHKEVRVSLQPSLGQTAEQRESIVQSMMKDRAPLNSLNFNDVELGGVSSRVVYLKNSSSLSVSFCVHCGPNSVFQAQPLQGNIAPGSEYPIKVIFTPEKPINYYRRVFVLLNDALPQFYDAYGSGFIRAKGEIPEQRPLPIRHAHIQAYRNRVLEGYGGLNPEELDSLLDEVGMCELFAGSGAIGTLPKATTVHSSPLSRSGEAARTDLAVVHEMFIDQSDSTVRDVYVDKPEIDFGFTPHGSVSDPRFVSITNKTTGKITVMWRVPGASMELEDSSSSSSVLPLVPTFDVSPATDDIAGGETKRFKVLFKPTQSARNYMIECEAYCFFKNQRTFRLVNDPTLVPPWCLPLTVFGNTFGTGSLMTNLDMKGGAVYNGRLLFPNCYLGDSVFETLKLRNTGNLSAVFHLYLGWEEADVGNAVHPTRDLHNSFAAYPSAGEIPANGFMLIYVRFTAKAPNTCLQLLRCVTNGSNHQTLLLEGHAGLPSLCFPRVMPSPELVPTKARGYPLALSGFQGSFYLKPTCVGLSNSTAFPIKNSSRLPLKFRIMLPASATGVLNVSPAHGLLRGNEQVDVVLSFAPKKVQRYDFRVHVKAFPIGGPPPRVVDARQPGKVGPVEALQVLSVNIIAPGDEGAVLFDPPRATTGVLLVNTREEVHMQLENISSSDLAYYLTYKVAFTPEEGSTNQAKGRNDLRKLLSISEGEANRGDEEGVHELVCDKPSGILPARSRRRLTFVFKPSRAGLFDFTVLSNIKMVDSDGKVLEPTADESGLLTSIGGGLTFKASDLLDDSDTSESLPLVAKITSRASFPTLLIEDVRTVGDVIISDVEQLWRQFSLYELNQDLGLPLSDDEILLNTQSSPDLTKLKRYSFHLTPNVLHAPRQTVLFLFKNSGFLPTSFRLHLPNEKDLELEQWCDDDENTEERLRQISIIEDLKIFELEPRSGALAPGESMTITVSYSHSTMKFGGHHHIPILMRLHQGKQVWLDLVGRTLSTAATVTMSTDQGGDDSTSAGSSEGSSVPAPCLLLFPFAGADHVCSLSPVPIGIAAEHVPLQRTEIVNVSALDTAYEVDVTALRHLARANNDIEILRVTNPKGSIPPRSSLFLEWYFYPQEATSYELSLAIRYYRTTAPTQSQGGNEKGRHSRAKILNTQFLQLVMKASGFDPRLGYLSMSRPFLGATPLPRQAIMLDNPLVSLSVDILEFGVIPQGSKDFRLIIMKNISSASEVDFSIDWSTCLLNQQETLTVSPAYGRISPGDSLVLHVTIHAKAHPLIFQDAFKVTVREVLKQKAQKEVSLRQTKILERITTKKIGSSSHENLVQSSTESRTRLMQDLPMGHVGTMPSSTNSVDIPPSRKTCSYESEAVPHATISDEMSLGNRTSGSMQSQSSRGSKRATREAPAAHYGPSHVFSVRLKGEIHSVDTTSLVFSKGPWKNEFSAFIIPQKRFFVSNQSSDIHSPGAVGRTLVGEGPMSMSSRFSEFRSIASSTLENIFRRLTQEVEIIDHVQQVANSRADGLQLPEVGPMVPLGRPKYPLYFSEIIPKKPLSLELIIEMRLLGVPHIPEDESELSGPVKTSLDQLDPYLPPSTWTKDTNLFLKDASSYRVYKHDLRQTLSLMGVNPKGATFTAIDNILKANGREKCVHVKGFFESLPSQWTIYLTTKVHAFTRNRIYKERLMRRSEIKSTEEVIDEESVNTHFLSRPDDETTDEDTLEEDGATGHASMAPHIKAFMLLQDRIRTRRSSSVALVKKKKAALLEHITLFALSQDGFFEIAAEVVVNSMFDLMQEATYGEFNFDAEPVKFLGKK